MQKIIYWVGIYAICTTIHDILDYRGEEYVKKLYFDMGKHRNSKRKEKGPIGVQVDSARKPTGKIGFAIPED